MRASGSLARLARVPACGARCPPPWPRRVLASRGPYGAAHGRWGSLSSVSRGLSAGPSRPGGSGRDEGADAGAGEAEPGHHGDVAADIWRTAVEGTRGVGRGISLTSPSLPRALYAWLVKRLALLHARGVSPAAREEGLFDDIEADVTAGAQQCLRFLADGLGDRSGADSSLQPPFLEAVLSDRLRGAMGSLRKRGCVWRWELADVADARLERIFMVIGASRTGSRQRGPIDIHRAWGQDFVLRGDQPQRFLGDMRSRMGVLQELLHADMTLVADVSVRASQRSGLVIPGGADHGAEAAHLAAALSGEAEEPPSDVHHLLRLEMAFSQERTSMDGTPFKRPSPWVISDWNWICRGNHPAIPSVPYDQL